MSEKSTPEVRVGQVWADNDKRSAGRHVKVVELLPAEFGYAHVLPKPARARVALCDKNGRILMGGGRPKHTTIRISRFKPTSTGYRLVKDTEPTDG